MDGVEEMIGKNLGGVVRKVFERNRGRIDFGERPGYEYDWERRVRSWTRMKYGFY